MLAALRNIRLVTPSELAFRLSESVRFLRERTGSKPRVRLSPGYSDSGVGFLPEILFGFVREREAICNIWKQNFPESVEETLAVSEGILENRIPIFSETMDYHDRIDWHLEPVSGRKAPLMYYRDIDTLDPGIVGDAKYIWELNRHNFLVFLGKAYWANGERRYYDKWREIILSWIEDNPYNLGINWESSLELAFRAINWIWSGYYFRNELEHDGELRGRMFETLYFHAHHIYSHLSYYFSPNTHLTGEALGLLYIGKAFPCMKPASRWVSTAAGILESELDRQILDDGGYFEMTTYYHKYTIDFYVHYLLLQGGHGRLRRETTARVGKMLTHLVLISEPDGTIPLLGDSDGGQLLFLTLLKRNIKGACCTAAVILEDGELKHLCGPDFQEEAMWLLGSRGLERYQGLRETPLRHYHSRHRDTGLYCFRNGIKEEDSYILIDCGPHGWKACGHAHSDLLSYVWYSGGGMVLTDPGTFTYSGSKSIRDRSRSSSSHNTITINGVSQSVPGETFRWEKIARPKYARSRLDADCGFFEGAHDAYEKFRCRHKRIVLYLGNALSVIVDVIKVVQPLSSLLYNLQFNEGSMQDLNDQVFRFDRESDGRSYYLGFFGTLDFAVNIREGVFYPDYGKAVTSPRIELTERNITRDQKIMTILCRDPELAASLRFHDGERITGSSSSGEYSVMVGDHDIKAYRDGKQVLLPESGT